MTAVRLMADDSGITVYNDTLDIYNNTESRFYLDVRLSNPYYTNIAFDFRKVIYNYDLGFTVDEGIDFIKIQYFGVNVDETIAVEKVIEKYQTIIKKRKKLIEKWEL